MTGDMAPPCPEHFNPACPSCGEGRQRSWEALRAHRMLNYLEIPKEDPEHPERGPYALHGRMQFLVAQIEQAEATLRQVRDLFTINKWWVGNRASSVVKLIDTALADNHKDEEIDEEREAFRRALHQIVQIEALAQMASKRNAPPGDQA